MKKFLSLVLCALLLLSAISLVGCGGETEQDTTGDIEQNPENTTTLQFGLGLYTEASATSANVDANGQSKVTITLAAITVDADGKVVACEIDTADNSVSHTADGKAIARESFSTKRELGYDYNMKNYGAPKEWFEQADAFEAVVAGKTLNEIKALVVDSDKGTDEVLTAGCTITINEFVLAIEKAFANLAESNATADSALKIGVYTEQTGTDATVDANGQNKLETTIFAAAVDADGKIVAASSDCVQTVFAFDTTGASLFDATKPVSSKKELGYDYNMKNYGAALEWFEHAAAFDALCVGKTAAEVGALLAADNYGTDDVKAAGCTILVDGFVKAAVKIGY